MKRVLALTILALMVLGSPGGVSAHGDSEGDLGQQQSSEYLMTGLQDAAGGAASYINPDTGAITANTDVDAGSSCATPDQADTQDLSDAGLTINNVHNDACFLDADGNKIDGAASFESSGVGIISACPDPDGDGAKTSMLSADGLRCYQSGFQETGNPGDQEFHARLNNDTEAGEQTVVFCTDANNDGCADEQDTSTIILTWVVEGGEVAIDQPGGAASYINPDTAMITANTDVDPTSSCATPDQADTQELSDAGLTINNVHNDACFLDAAGNKIDGAASFESSGVGVISACPDPDGEGPKTSMLSADGLRCYQSGFQETGNPGDQEFHARLNNDLEPGMQTIVFCADANNNGCGDEQDASTITITWVAE